MESKNHALKTSLDMIHCFMKTDKLEEKHNDKSVIVNDSIRRLDSLEGQDLIDVDYNIDEYNDEIAEMFGVNQYSFCVGIYNKTYVTSR